MHMLNSSVTNFSIRASPPETNENAAVKVLIQPDEGIAPVLAGIEGVKKTIEIVIFRFDRGEIEKALKAAAARGVFVHALVAYTNRGGEKKLRKLETRLLEAGVTVARTADNLARYHDKLMIIDRRLLYWRRLSKKPSKTVSPKRGTHRQNLRRSARQLRKP
jgi:hypothetical protein